MILFLKINYFTFVSDGLCTQLGVSMQIRRGRSETLQRKIACPKAFVLIATLIASLFRVNLFIDLSTHQIWKQDEGELLAPLH